MYAHNDDQEEPGDDEVREYAELLGINPDKEKNLLWIAREGILAPLPPHWAPVETDDGQVYFYNGSSGESLWEHPLDAKFRQMADEERKKLQLSTLRQSPRTALSPLSLKKTPTFNSPSYSTLLEPEPHSTSSRHAMPKSVGKLAPIGKSPIPPIVKPQLKGTKTTGPKPIPTPSPAVDPVSFERPKTSRGKGREEAPSSQRPPLIEPVGDIEILRFDTTDGNLTSDDSNETSMPKTSLPSDARQSSFETHKSFDDITPPKTIIRATPKLQKSTTVLEPSGSDQVIAFSAASTVQLDMPAEPISKISEPAVADSTLPFPPTTNSVPPIQKLNSEHLVSGVKRISSPTAVVEPLSDTTAREAAETALRAEHESKLESLRAEQEWTLSELRSEQETLLLRTQRELEESRRSEEQRLKQDHEKALSDLRTRLQNERIEASNEQEENRLLMTNLELTQTAIAKANVSSQTEEWLPIHPPSLPPSPKRDMQAVDSGNDAGLGSSAASLVSSDGYPDLHHLSRESSVVREARALRLEIERSNYAHIPLSPHPVNINYRTHLPRDPIRFGGVTREGDPDEELVKLRLWLKDFKRRIDI